MIMDKLEKLREMVKHQRFYRSDELAEDLSRFHEVQIDIDAGNLLPCSHYARIYEKRLMMMEKMGTAIEHPEGYKNTQSLVENFNKHADKPMVGWQIMIKDAEAYPGLYSLFTVGDKPLVIGAL
jgi:hypothetical protein